MSRPLVLGIDGGGTATSAWIAEVDGGVVGRGKAGPSNIKAVGQNAAMTALELAIIAAFQDAGEDLRPVEVACLGLAGFGRDEDKALLRAWADGSAWSGRLVLVNDGDLVVTAGTPEGWGIGLTSGTGSIAVGRDREGRRSRCGGWGYVIGDEGSAFAVAVAALRRVTRRADGREPAPPGGDRLSPIILGALGITSADELVSSIYSAGFDRARIATLAPAVARAAEEEPALVGEILEPAGRELADLAAGAARLLGWHGGRLPLAMAGGFLLGCSVLSDALLGRLREAGYQVEASFVPDPVEGALILARRELAG